LYRPQVWAAGLVQSSKRLTSLAQIRVNIRDFQRQVTALVRRLR
jgi:hypothetical protein